MNISIVSIPSIYQLFVFLFLSLSTSSLIGADLNKIRQEQQTAIEDAKLISGRAVVEDTVKFMSGPPRIFKDKEGIPTGIVCQTRACVDALYSAGGWYAAAGKSKCWEGNYPTRFYFYNAVKIVLACDSGLDAYCEKARQIVKPGTMYQCLLEERYNHTIIESGKNVHAVGSEDFFGKPDDEYLDITNWDDGNYRVRWNKTALATWRIQTNNPGATYQMAIDDSPYVFFSDKLDPTPYSIESTIVEPPGDYYSTLTRYKLKDLFN